VDCTAQVTNIPTALGDFAEAIVRDGGYSSILAFWSQAGATKSNVERLRTTLKPVRETYPGRLWVLSVLAPREIEAQYEEDGLVVIGDPTRAVVAIHAMGKFGDAFAAPPPAAPPAVPHLALPATTPSEAQAKQLLAEAGIASAPERACADAAAAVAAARDFGFPVVMKILSPDIIHKSEIGGVLLDVDSEAAVREGFATLMQRGGAVPGARLEGVLVAKQLKGGVECIMGIHRDPVFGPVAMFGLGGIFVEILKDVVFRRCPFGEDVAEGMIRSIKGAPLLLGARGRKPADIKALAAMLARLSVFAAQSGERLRGIDLNPVFAMPEGEGALAVDAVIELADECDD
jgi:acyl-CoA synthetase (NDP forming)